MIMDLMNRNAREAATILDLEGQRTLTAARLIVQDRKDAWCGSTTMLDMNFVLYASFTYKNYKEYYWWERETVPKDAAQAPLPPKLR